LSLSIEQHFTPGVGATKTYTVSDRKGHIAVLRFNSDEILESMSLFDRQAQIDFDRQAQIELELQKKA
jgi:hypothetical protein